MTTYRIENTSSGVILGEYEGDTPEQALDAQSRDAGYDSQAEYEADVRSTLIASGLDPDEADEQIARDRAELAITAL